VTVLEDKLFAALADAESPQGIAAEIRLPPQATDLAAAGGCVFLDGIQDAGNVGAILRSAAAFGVPVAVLGPGCADAWSPKVLRAAMGAHFSIDLRRSEDLVSDLESFGGSIACAVPHGGVPIGEADLSGRLGWILGAEGQGVSPALASRAPLKVTIPTRAGVESLNVAAAAAILFYEAARLRRPGAPA
jgi:TrmH family RNA methyltransferase